MQLVQELVQVPVQLAEQLFWQLPWQEPEQPLQLPEQLPEQPETHGMCWSSLPCIPCNRLNSYRHSLQNNLRNSWYSRLNSWYKDRQRSLSLRTPSKSPLIPLDRNQALGLLVKSQFVV